MSHSSLSNQNYSPIIAQSTSEQTERPQQSNWLSSFWDALTRSLLSHCEPKVTQKRARSGELYYNLYDPTTKQSLSGLTENEARIWLDKLRY
jgi:hypothetical protein